MPGTFFRSIATYYLKHQPELTREGLARKLVDRLQDQAIEYHVKTVRRQLKGSVDTVPPEVELMMKELALADLELADDAALEAALEADGLAVPEENRLSAQVPIERVRRLMELWLHFNPAKSKRYLARLLTDELKKQGIELSFDALQCKLAGRGHLVRRELLNEVVRQLERYGIGSEDEAKRAVEALGQDLEQSIEGRAFANAKRFQKLCRFWQIQEKEASSRRLAQLLKRRLAHNGVRLGVDHLQRAIAGKSTRVRVVVLRELESLIEEALPAGVSLDEAMETVTWGGTRNVDLAWVKCEPIADMAQEWLRENPGSTMRQLALRLASTVRRMGYRSSHNSIQPALGGWKKKTRGYVYRAMLKQFPGRAADRIPDEHLVGGVPGAEFAEEDAARAASRRPVRARRRKTPPSYDTFLRETRRYLPHAKSDLLSRLMALRAEKMYGVPASEAQDRLLKKRGPRPKAAFRAMGKSPTEEWLELGGDAGLDSGLMDREDEDMPLDRVFEAD